MRYFGGKSKISKEISEYINKVGYNKCNISEANKESALQLATTSTHTHTHTHTLRRAFLWEL